jgi:hypothetical protein
VIRNLDSLDALAERWCPGAGVTATGPGQLSYRLPSGDLLAVELHAVSDDEAELVAWWSSPPVVDPDADTPADLAAAAMLLGPGLLSCEVSEEGIAIRLPLFLDGLSRQAFLGAVADLGRAYTMLDLSAAEGARRRAEVERARLAIAEMEEELALARQAMDGLPHTVTVAPAEWAPTHVVPTGGLPAWAVAGSAAAPVTTIDAGVEVEISETEGDWARVLASNGWKGWVDGRRLTPRR